jgi:DNA-binding NarL/FixJ family response regulator
MASAADGSASLRRETALRAPESSGSPDNLPGPIAANPGAAATKAAKIASRALRDVGEQGPQSVAVVTSADADEAILALRQSPPELVVFLKGQPAAMLMSYLRKTLDGELYVTANGSPRQFSGAIFREGAEALSEREQAVAKLAAAGARNKEIAWQLGISEGTVKLHLFRVYRKLRVANRVGLALALGGPATESEPASKP